MISRAFTEEKSGKVSLKLAAEVYVYHESRRELQIKVAEKEKAILPKVDLMSRTKCYNAINHLHSHIRVDNQTEGSLINIKKIIKAEDKWLESLQTQSLNNFH